MPDYLLDTNILRYWYDTSRPEHAKVLAHIQDVRRPDPLTQYVARLFISVITVGEIEYGFRANPTLGSARKAEYRAFLREECPQPLEIVTHVTRHYGELRAWLFDNCGPKEKRTKAKRPEELIDPTTGRELGIDENDIWIAAQAMTFNLVLVTHDSRGNFGKLLGQFKAKLRVEDWAK